MRDPIVILPMAGFGQRFQDAGYHEYKPFISIFGKPMINWALAPYPESLKKYLIVNNEALTPEQKHYLETFPNTTILEIDPHKLGPAYSIHMAKDQIPEAPCFVSYLDIFWTWDFNTIPDADGIVFTRQKFHPHLIQNNFSAFCKTKNNHLIEIREKGSFSDNWMEEPLSVGTFYFKSSKTMQIAFEEMINSQEKVANEFFPSQAFNHLIKMGQTISCSPVDFFVHWGTPEQLEDTLYWATTTPPKETRHNTLTICCMGGTGSRMKQINPNIPKACLPFGNFQMWETVSKTFSKEPPICIVTDEMQQLLHQTHPNLHTISVGSQTQSQVETLEKASPFLTSQTHFFLISCDAYGDFDHSHFENFLDEHNPEAVIFTFEPTLTQKKMGKHHSHVSLDKDASITAVHVKSKSSETDKGLAGFFWFKNGKVFDHLKHLHSNQELCVDHLLQKLCELGMNIKGYPLNRYYHLGTPEEFLEFSFWNSYRDVLH